MTPLALAIRALNTAKAHLIDAEADPVSDDTARLAKEAWHQVHRLIMAIEKADYREKVAKAQSLRGKPLPVEVAP